MKRFVLLAAAAGAVLVAGNAQAQTTVYKGYDANNSGGLAAPTNPNSSAASAAFQGVLSGTSTESFESFPTGTTAPLVLSFTGSAGTLNATLTGSGAVNTNPRSAPTGSGQFATGGNNYYAVTSSNFQIAFGSAVAAFGFFTTDIESNVQLIFTHVTGPSETFAFADIFGFDPINAPSGSVNFLGFTNTSNPFTGVTFAQGLNSGGDILAFDQMTIGDARQVTGGVPEPTTWAMMVIGFGAIGGSLRRRQKVATRLRFA